MGAGGNGNNQWEWEGNVNKTRLSLGLGINHREWEGMGLKKTFPLISSNHPNGTVATFVLLQLDYCKSATLFSLVCSHQHKHLCVRQHDLI